MASDPQLTEVTGPAEDEEFGQILRRIGGRGNVYLVGDVGREEGEGKCSLMKDFMAAVFPVDDTPVEANGSGEGASDRGPGSKGQRVSIGARSTEGRAMHCAVVVFLFRHAYVHARANHVCVREVLKDVRARTEGHGRRPALLGLVHANCESPETGESVELLEQMLRAVFRRHPHDSIWAGHFVPKAPDGARAIRRHVCSSVLSAQAAGEDNVPGRKGPFLWSLGRWFRRGRRERPGAASDNQVQKGGADEGIPLQMRAEPRV